MQVARLLEPKNRTWGGKLIEMFRALQLEWKYSKNDILQLYLSMIPLAETSRDFNLLPCCIIKLTGTAQHGTAFRSYSDP